MWLIKTKMGMLRIHRVYPSRREAEFTGYRYWFSEKGRDFFKKTYADTHNREGLDDTHDAHIAVCNNSEYKLPNRRRLAMPVGIPGFPDKAVFLQDDPGASPWFPFSVIRKRLNLSASNMRLKDIPQEEQALSVYYRDGCRFVANVVNLDGFKRMVKVSPLSPAGKRKLIAKLDGIPVNVEKYALPGRETEKKRKARLKKVREVVDNAYLEHFDRQTGSVDMAGWDKAVKERLSMPETEKVLPSAPEKTVEYDDELSALVARHEAHMWEAYDYRFNFADRSFIWKDRHVALSLKEAVYLYHRLVLRKKPKTIPDAWLFSSMKARIGNGFLDEITNKNMRRKATAYPRGWRDFF